MSREFFKTNNTSTHRAINLRRDRRDPSQNLVPKDDKNRHVTHGTNTLNGEKVKHAGSANERERRFRACERYERLSVSKT